ncbi:MAG: GNAT family N-acetyltransferase [Alphaproteobacteria bacterium]|nr:GNAT family N-acetyltransferase [Alphaproteobacteria bacterium]
MKRVRDDRYEIDDDRARIDLARVHRWIDEEGYWARGIPFALFKRSVDGARPFGIYAPDGVQVGFARVISDFATFGYIGDVFVDTAHRGKGLSKFLMTAIMEHPELQGFRRWMLVTADAHGLYQQFGFEPLTNPERVMERRLLNPYGSGA